MGQTSDGAIILRFDETVSVLTIANTWVILTNTYIFGIGPSFSDYNAGINLTGYHPPPRAPRGFCTEMCAQPRGFCTTENARGPGQ